VVFPAGKYENILVEKKGEKQNVGVITLNRPKALNALCNALMVDVNNALEEFQNDDSVGAIVLTGSERAFAAGNFIFYVIVSPLKDINLSKIV
jgi:enoyl-CoA hydratase/carnithine racemase